MLDIQMVDGEERIMSLSFDVGSVPSDSCRMYLQFALKVPDRANRIVKAVLRSGREILGTNTYDLDMVDEGEATKKNRIYDLATKWVMS